MIITSNDLYTQWVNLITQLTGRPVWRRGRMITNPAGAYATVWFGEGPSPAQEVIENVALVPVSETDPTLREVVWGTVRLEGVVAFYRDLAAERALDTAIGFKNALQLEARFLDIWRYCGLCGEIRTVDISGIFREDIEPAAEVRFYIYANLQYNVNSKASEIHQIDNSNLEVLVDKPQDFLIEKVINYTEGE